MKIMLWEFDDKLGTEGVFKPTIRNESLHQNSNDNVVGIVNIATPKKSNC